MRIESNTDYNIANVSKNEGSKKPNYKDPMDPQAKIALYLELTRLQEILAKKPLSEADAKELAKIMDNLSRYEAEGFLDLETEKTHAISKEMAELIEALKKTISDSTGVTIPSFPEKFPLLTPEQLGKWQELGAVVSDLITKGKNLSFAGLSNLISYSYLIKVGNSAYGELEKLQDALKTNQEILKLLKKLQELKGELKPGDLNTKHKITIDGKQYEGTLQDLVDRKNGFINFPSGEGKDHLFKQAFDELAKLSFNNPLGGAKPILNEQNYLEFEILRKELDEEIKKLEKESPDGDLVKKLKDLAAGMKGSALENWLLDGHGNSGDVGKVQRNISDAIGISEGVNDKLKMDLQPKMFNLETFFKTAAEIINSSHQSVMGVLKRS